MPVPKFTFATWSWLLAWLVSLYASLELHRFQGYVGHSICGPWGCAATPEALLGYHLFWTVLLVPVAWAIAKYVVIRPAYVLPAALIGSGICALIGMLYLAGSSWIAEGGDSAYLMQRMLFTLATNVDLPAVQIIVAGFAAWLATPKVVPMEASHT